MANLRKLMPVASAIVGLAGVVLIFGTISSPIGWMRLSDSYIAPGAALLIGAITTAVAQLGLETVADKRSSAVEAETRQNRSRVYEELLGHIVESFTRDGRTMSEAQARAKSVAWASSDTFPALTDWFRYAAAQMFKQVGADQEELLIRRELVYRVAARMRRDLQSEDFTRSQVLALIFNDFDPETPFPDEIVEGTVNGQGEFVRAHRIAK